MISSRLNPWWKLIATHESVDGECCVDVFTRPDRSFGFAEFRQKVGGSGDWSPVGAFADLQFGSPDNALAAAKENVEWLSAVLDPPAEAPKPSADYQPAPSSTTSRGSRRTRSPLGDAGLPG